MLRFLALFAAALLALTLLALAVRVLVRWWARRQLRRTALERLRLPE